MKFAHTILMIVTSLITSGQTDLPKQTVASHPPFTLTISYNQQNPNIEKHCQPNCEG